MALDISWLLPPAPRLPAMHARTAARVLPGLVEGYQGLADRSLRLAEGAHEAQVREAGRAVLPGLLDLDPLDPDYRSRANDVMRSNPAALYDRAVGSLLGLNTEERRFDEVYGSGLDRKNAKVATRERNSSVRQMAMDTNDWSLVHDYNSLLTGGFNEDEAYDFVTDQAAFRSTVLKQASSGVPREVLMADPEIKALVESNKMFAGQVEAAVKAHSNKRDPNEVTVSQQATLVDSLRKSLEDATADPDFDKAALAQLRGAYNTAMGNLASLSTGRSAAPVTKSVDSYLNPGGKTPTKPRGPSLTNMGR